MSELEANGLEAKGLEEFGPAVPAGVAPAVAPVAAPVALTDPRITGQIVRPGHDTPEPESETERQRRRRLARRMTIEDFDLVARSSTMSLLGKKCAHKVCVLDHEPEDVAERFGVTLTFVLRAVAAIVKRRPNAGTRYITDWPTFIEWFGERCEPALSEPDPTGFRFPGFAIGWVLRGDLDAWLRLKGSEVRFGPAQFGAMMKQRGFRAAMIGVDTVYFGVRVKDQNDLGLVAGIERPR